ncbi:AAA family ATPase [Streptomyces hypolithicus]
MTVASRGALPGPQPDARGLPGLPAVTELRLSAFRSHRGRVVPLTPVTLLAGSSGSGKTGVLQAYDALARLGGGAELASVFRDPGGCVPERAGPDAQGRRGFRIGCTAGGPLGPVRLDLAVQAEPRLRIVGERLTCDGHTLMATALRDPGRGSVEAGWYTGGSEPMTRAALPDDLLGTALLPLHVAGRTPGQLRVLAAAEQVVVALRSVFVCDPQPAGMREPVVPGEGRLRRGCDNLAEVLRRTHHQCARRHARLAAMLGAGCAGRADALTVEELADGRVRALVGRGGARGTPLGRLGDGELRYLALALVLLTGPGVLAVDSVGEVPAAMQALTVVADGFDRSLDGRQLRELVGLAAAVGGEGHIRLVGTVSDAAYAGGAGGVGGVGEVGGVSVVDLSDGERE